MSESEKKSIVTILRSVVNSLKNATLQDLTRDFAQIEGMHVPYQKFGFSNLPDFLISTGQFHVTPYQTVIAKTSAESAHISKLVAEQNSGKKKKVKRFVIQPQRHLHPTTARYPPQQAGMMGPRRPNFSYISPINNNNNYRPYPPAANAKNNSYEAYNNYYHHKSGPPRNYSAPQNGTQTMVAKRRENQPSMTFTFSELTSKESTPKPANPTQPIVANPKQSPPKPSVAKVAEPPKTSVAKVAEPAKPHVAKVPEPPKSSVAKVLAPLSHVIVKFPNNPEPKLPSPKKLVVPMVQKAPQTVQVAPPRNYFLKNTGPNVQSANQQENLVKPINPTQQPPQKPLLSIHSRLIIQPKPNPVAPSTVVKPEPVVLVSNNKSELVLPKLPPRPPVSSTVPPTAAPPLSSIHSRLIVRTEAMRASPQALAVKQETPRTSDESHSDAVAELAQYAKRRGWQSPKYKFLAASMSCKIEIRITLNGTVYSSLPRTFDTTIEGKKVMARDLLANLLKLDVSFNNEKILERLHEWLKQSPNGMFIQNIPELFHQRQNLTLPASWIAMVKSMPHKFSVEISCGNNEIVYAENPNNLRTDDLLQAFSAMTIIEHEKPTVKTMCQSPTDGDRSGKNERCLPVPSPEVSNCVLMDKLVLPWQEKSWNVTITNAKSTTEVWARLIGPEYSTQLDDLMVDIEMDIMHEKIRPKSLTVGNIYLAVSVYTHRVRIERTDFVHSQCLCFCVDSGIEEWYSTDQLFECRPDFIKFPAQAICLSLFGLSDCAGHPNAASCLEDALADQSLIADILSLQADYEEQLTNPNNTAFIKTILYDTSSAIDVQLNDVLLNEICANSLPPTLAEGYLNGVTIAYISDMADIYCHLTSQLVGMQFLQSRIARLFTTTRAPTQIINSEEELNSKGLYLVQDTIDGQWYRASVFEQVGKQCKVFYVDVGKSQTVDEGDIHCLNSFVLSKFPFQAIVFRLGNVGDTNPQMVTQLRDCLRPGSEAMVKVLPTFDRVPKAKVFMRFQNGPLICVNDSINLEAEIKMYSAPIVDKKPIIPTLNATSIAPTPTVRIDYISEQSSPRADSKMLPLSKSHRPIVGELFKVTVTTVTSPHNFKVRARRQRLPFESMMEALQVYAKLTPQFMNAQDIQPGQPYVCQRDNNLWCRAVVQRAINETMFVITFCDFGDVDVVKFNSLKLLPSAFRVLPELAINARLSGIAPLHADWQADDCILFRRLVENQNFVSHVSRVIGTSSNEVQVELRLIDVSSGEDVDVSQVLLLKNIAIKSEKQ